MKSFNIKTFFITITIVNLICLTGCQKTELQQQPKQQTNIVKIAQHSDKIAQKFSLLQETFFTLSSRYEMETDMVEKFSNIINEDEKLNQQEKAINRIILTKSKAARTYYPSQKTFSDIMFTTASRKKESKFLPWGTYQKYLERDRTLCKKNIKQLRKLSSSSSEVEKLIESYIYLLSILDECSTILSLNEHCAKDNQMHSLRVLISCL